MKKALRYSLSKYRVGQELYLYLSNNSAFSCKIEDVYMIDKKWYYDVDCNWYASGLVLENIHEEMLGYKITPTKDNIRLSSQLMKRFADML